MSFDNLRKNRNNIAKLVDEANKVNAPANKYKADERYWKPTVDKAGNGYAEIRFLPQVDGEDLPWVRYWDHGFKGPHGQWYIEKSLTSIGQDDPVSEANSILWNSGVESDKAIARERKRRLHYVSNIMVVSDPDNPANEGKVFLYMFGKKIFDKVMDIMQPSFQDEKPVNPYDLWEDTTFKIKIRQVEGYRNYDKSEFTKNDVFNDDSHREEIYNQVHALNELQDPANYKSYDELKAKLNKVLGIDNSPSLRQMAQLGESQTVAPTTEVVAPVTAEQFAAKETDDDATLSYFAKLAATE